MTCCCQISCKRLDGFQNNDRHGKQCESSIRAQRDNPGPPVVENPVIGEPASQRSGERPKRRVHQEVDGSHREDEEFPYTVQASLASASSSNPALGSPDTSVN